MRRSLIMWILLALILAACGQQEEGPAGSEAMENELVTPASPEPAAEIVQPARQAETYDTRTLLVEAVGGDHRESEAAARDQYRHPVETLMFFGLEPDMTVVELWPGGGGWYTAVLAPVLDEHGQLVVASYPPQADSDYYRESEARYRAKLEAHPDVYGAVEIVPFLPPEYMDLGGSGSADMVVTFRNLHNWHEQGVLDGVFQAAYEVLKPGGVFGVVEHRAAEGVSIEEAAGSGYMPTEYVIGLASETGFELAAQSEINANPNDTADYEQGVWTLPPSYRLCRDMEGEEKQACMEEYEAIGESDRMTLKFVKPEGDS